VHRGDVRAAIFLGDGSRIVTACEDGGVLVWSADTGKLLHEHNSGGGPVAALDATGDGDYVAAGLEDGSVRIWETRYGRPVLRLDGSGHPITAVRFLPGESRLVTADTLGVVTLWDLGSASIMAQKATESAVAALAVHPDGEHLLTADSQSPAVTLWRLPQATN
jgi:WD40 repeat protein